MFSTNMNKKKLEHIFLLFSISFMCFYGCSDAPSEAPPEATPYEPTSKIPESRPSPKSSPSPVPSPSPAASSSPKSSPVPSPSPAPSPVASAPIPKVPPMPGPAPSPAPKLSPSPTSKPEDVPVPSSSPSPSPDAPSPVPRSSPTPTLAPVPSSSPAPSPVASAPDISPNSTALVSQILQKLDSGNIAFNTPAEMQIENSIIVELVLSQTKSVSELQAEIDKNFDKTNIDSAQVKISNRMRASLTGYGFIVEALTPDEQLISNVGTTTWRWEVTPELTGTRKLHLDLAAIIDINKKEKSLIVKTYSKDIKVKISSIKRLTRFFNKNMEWIVIGLLVPLSTLIWTRLFKNTPNKLPKAKEKEKVGPRN